MVEAAQHDECRPFDPSRAGPILHIHHLTVKNSAYLLASVVPVLSGTPAFRLQMDRQKPQVLAAARYCDVRCPTLERIALSKRFQIIVAAIGHTPMNGEPCRHVAKARLRTVPARTAVSRMGRDDISTCQCGTGRTSHAAAVVSTS